jgi:hypothetical protein
MDRRTTFWDQVALWHVSRWEGICNSAVQSRGLKLDNDRVAKICATRRKLAADGPASVRSAGDFERVSIPNSDGDALRDLLIAERANSAIEIGLAYGSSALA